MQTLSMGTSKPRRQKLNITTNALIEPVFAVVRVSWFEKGKPRSVDELQLDDGIDNVESVLETLIKNALTAGADVSVLTVAPAECFDVE